MKKVFRWVGRRLCGHGLHAWKRGQYTVKRHVTCYRKCVRCGELREE